MTWRRGGVTVVLVLALSGCAGHPSRSAPPAGSTPSTPTTPSSLSGPSSPPSQQPSSTSTGGGRPGGTPPPWLGTRPLPRRADGYGEIEATPRRLRHRAFTLPDSVAALPGRGFASRVEPAPAAVIARSTWRPGCPVAAADLAWVRLTFRGFDHQRHTGELLVNQAAADDLVSVFRTLWRARFPIEEMRITTEAESEAAPTGDGNDTGSFVCRPTVGATSFSQHAYGLAIDVDPFQNPYTKGDLVLPELASSYLDRADVRPGVITPDGVVVRAFAAIGWTWGGSWSSLKDYQHFSRSGG